MSRVDIVRNLLVTLVFENMEIVLIHMTQFYVECKDPLFSGRCE